MKKCILIFFILGMGKLVLAQTNTFPSSGNVGIGTISPSQVLEVQSTGAAIMVVNSTATTTGATEGGRLDLRLQGGTSNYGFNGDVAGSIWMIGQANDASYGAGSIRSITTTGGNIGRNGHIADMVFSTKPAGSDGVAEALRIKGDGKIGLGTANPVSKFVVSNGGANGFEIDPITGTNGGIGLLAYNRNTSSYKTLGFAADDFRFITGNTGEIIRLTSSGNIGIGTTDPQGYKLAVNGNMIAESVKVKLQANWPDYVFKNGYSLKPLSEVEQYIKVHEHLPDIPSASEVKEEGLNLGEMNAKLLRKIEELTLYLIEQNRDIRELKSSNEQLRSEINQLKSKL